MTGAGPTHHRIEVATPILASNRERVGLDLVPPSGDRARDAAELFELAAVVLCHDGADDPVFIYANAAAAALWRMDVSELIGMPSRLTAPPERRDERSAMLDEATTTGVLQGYSGERVASDGTRFVISDATLWKVDGLPMGPGLAAMFTRWRPQAS